MSSEFDTIGLMCAMDHHSTKHIEPQVLHDSPVSDDPPYILASGGLLDRKSGEWAKRKHHYLRNYCGITAKSMRNKWKLV